MRLLHISDPHFTADSNRHYFRLPDDARVPARDLPTLAEAISDACIEASMPSFDLLAVTGDLTWRAKPEEFKVAQRSITELAKRLHVPRDRVLVIPGNHDWDWSKPTEHRGDAFSKYFPSPTGVQLPDCRLIEHRDKNAKQIVFLVGLNSASIESPEDAGIGYANANALRTALNYIDTKKSSGYHVKTVLCLHHHLLPVTYVERDYFDRRRSSVTLDARAILATCSERGVDLVLHGHQHQPALSVWSSCNPLQRVETALSLSWVVGAGSSGAAPAHLGDALKRHFHAVDLCFDTLRIATVRSFASSNDDPSRFCALDAITLPRASVSLAEPSCFPRLRSAEEYVKRLSVVEERRVDESDLFLLLLKSDECVDANDYFYEHSKGDAYQVLAIYDLYGEHDLLVKVRADNKAAVDAIVRELEGSRLIRRDTWGSILDVWKEHYPLGACRLFEQDDRRLKVFVWFLSSPEAKDVCLDVVRSRGEGLVSLDAVFSIGGEGTVAEFEVACGAYYVMNTITRAIESRIRSGKVTMLAQSVREFSQLGRSAGVAGRLCVRNDPNCCPS